MSTLAQAATPSTTISGSTASSGEQSGAPGHRDAVGALAASGGPSPTGEAAVESGRSASSGLHRQTAASEPLEGPRTGASAPPIASTSKLDEAAGDGAPADEPVRVHAVLLVSFDHTLGPIVEFGYPEVFQDDAELNKNLPFLALPDGSHAVSWLAQFSKRLVLPACNSRRSPVWAGRPPKRSRR